MNIEPIADIHTDFPTKFGVPRQSGLAMECTGTVIFRKEFRQAEAVKGLDGYSHIWLIWDFSLAHREGFHATVCPPRLGGNTHVGVFATRSPFRPNHLGLSSVRLDSIEYTEENGPVLHISGIDMMDSTPVYDIKPYVADYDSHPEARGGFTEITRCHALQVEDPDGLISASGLSPALQSALFEVLSQDPRPGFDREHSSGRRFGFFFDRYDVRFTVEGSCLTVVELVKR